MKSRAIVTFAVIFILGAAALGCDVPHSSAHSSEKTDQQISFYWVNPEPQCVWRRMATSFEMQSHFNNPRVQHYIKKYSAENAANLRVFSKRAAPHLYHIVNMLDELSLPHELALLPIVESEYKPSATSKVGAAGLWQLAPATGRIYGLKQDRWYDGRRDTDLATRAALGHLKAMHTRFNGDWLLALAAYNAGDGRVSAAIRKNKQAGKPTDYWSLQLPTETQHFVPKFLALAYLVKNAPDLSIDLEHVPNKPYFAKVELPSQIEIKHAAQLADLEMQELKLLNPALRAHATHPNGPHHIVLPVEKVDRFNKNYKLALNAAKNNPTKITTNGDKYHTVVRGDTLNIIAAKYSTTVKALKNKNNLKSDIIRSGQKLAV